MGVGFDELKTNFADDFRLHEEITSACSLVRDYSIKELIKANGSASRTIKDICYGSGYALVDGKMVQSGACTEKVKNPQPLPNNADSTSVNTHVPGCALKEGDVYVNWNRDVGNTAFVPKTWPERVEDKHRVD